MASKVLKGLAVAAGTGLAIGFGRKRRAPATPIGASSDNTPAMEPLLDRLEHIEVGLQLRDVSVNSVLVSRRVYRGDVDTPKTVGPAEVAIEHCKPQSDFRVDSLLKDQRPSRGSSSRKT